VIQDGDVSSHGFHVRNNVRGENDDAFTGKFREQISKTHALLGIEAGGGFIDDQELRIVEQGLRNADALAHAARKFTERTIANVRQIDHGEKFVDAATRRARFKTFDGGEVFQNSNAVRCG
jgi:hypothetical protein